MPNKLIRFGFLAMLIVYGLLALERGPKTYSDSHPNEIDLVSFPWGITNQQLLRICIPGEKPSPQTGTWVYDVTYENQAGDVILAKEVRVSPGEFRCLDSSYEELLRAGLLPEPTSRIQFLVGITLRSSANRSETVGANKTISVGAAQSIDVVTGKTDLYQAFKTEQSRQITIIQDL